MQPLYQRCFSIFHRSRCNQLMQTGSVHHHQLRQGRCHVVQQLYRTSCMARRPTPVTPRYHTCTTQKQEQKRSRSTRSEQCSPNASFKSCGQRALHTTLDEEEIDKFRGMSESWWDVNGEFQALHSLNDLRVPLIKDGLVRQYGLQSLTTSEPLANAVILDVGCGGGILAEPLARLGATVIGVDAASENIHAAQEHASHDPLLLRRLKYICATAEDLLGTEEEAFDAVIASEVLEHVSDVESLVATCCQLLKPGGSLFLTTINKTWFSYALAVVGAEDIAKIVPQGTHNWNKFIPPEDLQSILQANGCQVRLVHGMIFNPITQRWSWATPKVCNYAIHAIRNGHNHTSGNTQSSNRHKD